MEMSSALSSSFLFSGDTLIGTLAVLALAFLMSFFYVTIPVTGFGHYALGLSLPGKKSQIAAPAPPAAYSFLCFFTCL